MTKSEAFLAELKQEAKATRKILEAVPMDKADWKPHDKSMTLGKLAIHVAEIPGWYKETLIHDELDFAKPSDTKPFSTNSTAELVAHFDQYLEAGINALTGFPDSKMQDPWTMRAGEQIFFTLPKEQVVRSWCLNHWYHHRAQLGVYLRLLNVPVPGTYGPSADGI